MDGQEVIAQGALLLVTVSGRPPAPPCGTAPHVTTRDTGRRAVGQFESATPGHVHVAGMVRRLGLAVLIGLLAVGTFVARRHPATVEPPPSPQRPHAVIVPRLGPPGFCLLQPSGSLRCSQEPPWGRRTNPLLRPVSTASN